MVLVPSSQRGVETYRRADHLAPQVELVCNGRQAIDLRAQIGSVEVSQAVDGASTFTLELQDQVLEGGVLRWMDSPDCQPGNTFEIKLGYAGRLAAMIDGYLERVSATFSDGPGPSLTLSGADRGQQALRQAPKGVHLGEQMTDSDVVAVLADHVGLRAETDPTNTSHWSNRVPGTTVQSRIAELAKRTGYEYYLTGRTLHFKRKGSRVRFPRPVLTWGGNLLSLSSSFDLSQCVSSVVVQGIDRGTRETLVATAEAGSEAGPGAGGPTASQLVRQHFGDTPRVISRRPVSTREEADQLARSELEGAGRSMNTTTCSVVGDPSWSPGMEVELAGVGKGWLRGVHRVRSVQHRVSVEGYRCALTWERSQL